MWPPQDPVDYEEVCEDDGFCVLKIVPRSSIPMSPPHATPIIGEGEDLVIEETHTSRATAEPDEIESEPRAGPIRYELLPTSGRDRERSELLPTSGRDRERSELLPTSGRDRERSELLPTSGRDRERSELVEPIKNAGLVISGKKSKRKRSGIIYHKE
jgi:hypothetical protein